MNADSNQATSEYADWRSDNTPPSLWNRVLADQTDAWEKLLRVWTPCVYDFCARKGIQKSDANDVVQLVMLRVFKNRHRFDDKEKGHRLRAWLLMIIKQCIADHYRQFASKNAAIGGSAVAGQLGNLPDLLESIDSLNDSDACFDPGLWMAKTLEVIKEEVTPQTWEIFKLYKIDNLSAKEVGQQFEMSTVAVRQRAFSVTERIKREAAGIFHKNPEI